MIVRRGPRRAAAVALGVAIAASTIALAPACAQRAPAQRYGRAQVRASLARLEDPGLLIGIFPLSARAVTDGDTIRVSELDASLRLLGLDAEETLKDEQSRRAVESDWPAYLRDRRGSARHPTKAGTPMGDEAKRFAKAFFARADRVRLERDHPKEIRDRYDRYLAYAFVERGGRWLNYNVECVRAGMSPYFTKYSYSRRFHDEFVAAEAEARAARRGIWDPAKQAYTDYAERKAWWDARAEFIKAFERDARGRDDFLVLTHWDADRVLKRHLGQELTVLGTVSRVYDGDRGPARVLLGQRRSRDLAAVFFDRAVFAASGVTRYEGEFVRVSGVVSEYTNKHTGRRQLQLVVDEPSQVVGSQIPGLAPPAPAAAAAARP